jgi:hypothetical protein
MSLLDYSSFLNETINESAAVSFDALSDSLKKAAVDAGKESQLKSFLDNTPAEASSIVSSLMKEIGKNPGWTKEFIDELWTLSPSDLAKGIPPKKYADGSLGGKIFNEEPKGMGRGEIFLAWLLNNSAAQGGGKDFDLLIDGNKYEVKDYRGKNNRKPIRLGVQGACQKFYFWKQIIKTLTTIENLEAEMQGGGKKFDIASHFNDKDFASALTYIISRKLSIPQGKFGRTDYKNFKTFYEKISTVKYVADQYTAIEVRGPGVKPMEFSVKPISTADVQKGTFKIDVVKGEQTDSDYVLVNLRRLDYARNPSQLDKDMQDAVNQITSHAPIIVFRNEGIALPKDFVFYSVDQGGVRIIEKSLAGSASDED